MPRVSYPLGLVGEPGHVLCVTRAGVYGVQGTLAALQSKAGTGPIPSDSVYRPKRHSCSNPKSGRR